MTVAVTAAISGPFAGNGATTAFPFTFKAMTTAEVAVYVDGALASTADYTVTINSSSDGGTVTFGTAPANGTEIFVVSAPSFAQEVAFRNGGPFLETSHDTANDRAAIRDLLLKRRIDGSIRTPVTEALDELPPASERTGQYLAFDASLSANPVASAGTGADLGLRTDLAANTGFQLIQYKPALAGSYARSGAELARIGNPDDTNVFHYIDPDLDAGILDGSNTTDLAAYLQTGVNASSTRPLTIPKGSFKSASQLVVPANAILRLLDGADLYSDVDSIESLVLVETDDVQINAALGSQVRMPLTNSAGLKGVCVLVRGTARTKIRGLVTQNGHFGLSTLDCDDLDVADCIIRNSYNWGLMSGGNRNFSFRNIIADTTRDSSASDCFKVYGLSAVTYSTRTSYNGAFINCLGIGAGGVGQAFDVISDNDAVDDLYNIAFINPVGRACGDGFFEIKVTELVVTNYPLHGVTIQGGAYYGMGTESVGVSVKDRIYDIELKGTKVHDVGIGYNVSAACRQVRLNDVVSVRSRNEGIKWLATGSHVGSQIMRPTVIDPNYGEAASTYAGISIQDGDDLLIDSPTVMRSQGASGPAHSYGIEMLATASRINLRGNVSLSGHATGPISNAAADCAFPATYKSAEIALSDSPGGKTAVIDALEGAFVACAYSVHYTEASNVARAVNLKARDTSSSTLLATFNTSATGALYQRDRAMIAAPVRSASSQPSLVAELPAVALPGSPTGKVIIKAHGFVDAAQLL